MGASSTGSGRASSGRSGDRGADGSGGRRLGWLLAAAGVAGLAAAVAASPADARAAASQDWPPFVLVAGLLLIGLVASDEGLFAAAGRLGPETTDLAEELRATLTEMTDDLAVGRRY